MFRSPLLLGFDAVERTLEQASKLSSDGYPPYDIEQIGDDRLRITVAVAGFDVGELAVDVQDRELIVSGRRTPEPDGDRIFLHRGIAARRFQRRFVLADGIVVDGATLESGLLHIDLLRPAPERRSTSIPIATHGPAARRLERAGDE